MPNFNRVVLVGHLCRDNEVRYSQAGLAILNNAIAVTEKRGKGDDRKEETMFIDITVFGKTAEFVNSYTHKGSAVLIEGRLRLEQWSDKETGAKRSKHSISVDNVQLMDSRKGGDAEPEEPKRASKRPEAAAESMLDDSIPFARFVPWPE